MAVDREPETGCGEVHGQDPPIGFANRSFSERIDHGL